MIYPYQCYKPLYFFFQLVNMVYLNHFNIHQHLEFIMVIRNVNLFIQKVKEPLYLLDVCSYHLDHIIQLLGHILLDLGIFQMFIYHIMEPWFLLDELVYNLDHINQHLVLVFYLLHGINSFIPFEKYFYKFSCKNY